MKIKLFLLLIFICIFQTTLLAQEKYGTLKVFTEIKGSQIYIDDKWAGQDSVVIEYIAVGTHYVRVQESGNVYFSKLVEIKPNEVNTVLVKAKKGMPKKKPKVSKEGLETNLSMYLSLTNSNYQPNILLVSQKKDIGTRAGIGISYRAPVRKSMIFDGGFIYYLTEGSYKNALGDTVNVSIIPAYANILLNPSGFFFFGGGVNYSFWSVHGTSGESPFNYNFSGGLGFQILGGFELGSFRTEIGYIIQNASYRSTDIRSEGFFVNSGLKI